MATVTYGTINALALGSATITVTTEEGSKTAVCSVTVLVAPTITTTALTDVVVGTAYSQTLTATGDTPITWGVEELLPDGLSLNGTTGIISGMPRRVGTFPITVKATNAAASDTKTLSINVKEWTWTAVTQNVFGLYDTILAIAYGNGKFVAGGGKGEIAYLWDN